MGAGLVGSPGWREIAPASSPVSPGSVRVHGEGCSLLNCSLSSQVAFLISSLLRKSKALMNKRLGPSLQGRLCLAHSPPCSAVSNGLHVWRAVGPEGERGRQSVCRWSPDVGWRCPPGRPRTSVLSGQGRKGRRSTLGGDVPPLLPCGVLVVASGVFCH